jgi:hypothetical protein
MKKLFRFLLVAIFVAGIAIFASQKAAWASPPPPIDVTGDPVTGTGPYKLGGCVTGNVKDFKTGIKLNAAMLDGWNSYPTAGLPAMPNYYWSLPGGPADIFSCLVNIKLLDGTKLLNALPNEKGTAEVCLETPVGKNGSIYFLDKFFKDNPVWVKVGGPFVGGTVACVPALNSGVYAYYAPEPAGHPEPTKTGGGVIGTHKEGSVDVPDDHETIEKPGPIILGGCVTGEVKDLPEGSKLEAQLVRSWQGLPQLPRGVGEFYRCIADLKFFDNGKLVNKLPAEKGYATICFSIPPQSNGSIYFLDKYFTKNAAWVPVAGPFTTGISCGPADQSGLYGMVDKK